MQFMLSDQIKLANICETFLLMARDYGDPVHILRALSSIERYYNNAFRFQEATSTVDEIVARYNYGEHSARIIQVYGTDRALGAMGLIIFSRLLIGNMRAANEAATAVSMLLPAVTHIHTLETTALPLMRTCVAMQMFDRALEVFCVYYRITKSSGGYCMFRETNALILECLMRLSATAPERKAELRASVGQPADTVASLRLLTRDCKAIAVERNKSIIAQDYLGFGYDCARAHLCLSCAKESLVVGSPGKGGPTFLGCEGASAVDLCCAGLSYVHLSLAASAGPGEGPFYIHRLHCIWVKIEILIFMLTLVTSHTTELLYVDFETGYKIDSKGATADIDNTSASSYSNSSTDCSEAINEACITDINEAKARSALLVAAQATISVCESMARTVPTSAVTWLCLGWLQYRLGKQESDETTTAAALDNMAIGLSRLDAEEVEEATASNEAEITIPPAPKVPHSTAELDDQLTTLVGSNADKASEAAITSGDEQSYPEFGGSKDSDDADIAVDGDFVANAGYSGAIVDFRVAPLVLRARAAIKRHGFSRGCKE